MKKCIFLFFTLFINLVAIAQEQKINTVLLDELLHVGINPAGELYTATPTKITRFDKDGKMINELILPSGINISQFDSWHLTQFVLYYRETQRVEIYNPQLDLRSSFTIDSVFAIEPEFITASFDQKHFWIFDKADGSIKKVNYKTGEVLIDEVIRAFNTKQNPILSMREYQRFLFLQTNTTLFVFNAMGNHIHSFEVKTWQNFDFFGEELFLVAPHELQLTSLFTTEKRSISIEGSYNKVLLTDDRLFGITKNTIEIFGFTPN